jgi:regulator of protease activity HflC (stomatin/prohibitin superfamily)
MGVVFFLGFIIFVVLGCIRALKVTRDSSGYSLESFHFHAPSGIPFFAAAAILLVCGLSYTTIDAGRVGIVKRFGKPVRELQPGIHFIVPVADSVTPVLVQTRIVKPSEDASSRDLQVVHTEVTLAYHVDSAYATNILVQLNDDAEDRVITPAILEAIKSVTAQYDVQELVSKRPEVRDKIESFVMARLLPYHIIAETTSITDFKFSQQYEQSIEAKVTAQQLAEKAENDLNRIKIEADQKVAAAEGEAKALEVQKQQITPELLQLRTIEMMNNRWDGHLPETIVGGNGALPMMDVLQAARRTNGAK